MAVRRKWWIGAALIVLMLLGLLAWNWTTLSARARLGAAYGARIGCSCRYVEGRAMGSCADDKEPGMALVTLTEHSKTGEHVPLPSRSSPQCQA